MVSINNSTSGAEAHLPFGGNGKSGNGSRQSGIWVLDQFTRWQAVNWDYSGRLQKAQMDVAELVPDESYRLREWLPSREGPVAGGPSRRPAAGGGRGVAAQ
jgi:aldehyde dehydrogenase (NAD+)